MSRLVHRLILRTTPLWRLLGADPRQLAALLEVRLLVDNRRPPALADHFSGGGASASGAMAYLLVGILFFMGLLLSVLFWVFADTATALFFYLSIWMVLLTMTLVTDFSEVLLDPRDPNILLPRPVAQTTLTLARLLHVCFYLFKLNAAFALPGLVLFTVKEGLSGLGILSLQLLLSLIMVLLLVSSLYMLIVRLGSPQKVRAIIAYFQIGFTSLVFGAYILLPQLIKLEGSLPLRVMEIAWLSPAPSLWIAALWDLFTSGAPGVQTLLYSVLAFVMPVLSLILILWILAPQFNQLLLQGARQGGPVGGGAGKSRSSLGDLYRNWWRKRLAHQEEVAAFDLGWILSGRDRDYQLRTLPVFGLIVAYFFYFLLQGEGAFADRLGELKHSKFYLLPIYLFLILAISLIQNAFYTKKPERAWVFVAYPVRAPGYLLTGTIAGVMARLFFPGYLLLSVLVTGFWGWQVIPDLLFGLSGILLAVLISCQLEVRHLPFSRSLKDAQNGQSAGILIISGLMAALFGGLHYLLRDLPFILLLLLPLPGIAVWKIWQAYRRLGWKSVLLK